MGDPMAATTLDDTAYLLIAASSEAMLSLAAPSVARHLNISEAQAKAQLRAGRVQLGADGVQMMSVLKALGLEPRAESALLQWLSITAPAEAAAAIASEVGMPVADVAQALQRPGGLVLHGQPRDPATEMRARLARIASVTVVMSQSELALHDLFATQPIDPREGRRLSAYLALVGLTHSQIHGSLVAGVTKSQADQLLARFPDCGLLALDRAFQRFDLYLTGIGTLPAPDAAAFLETRTNMNGVMVECVTPLRPLLLEPGLSRRAARAFTADYAAIGLETCLRLVNGNS